MQMTAVITRPVFVSAETVKVRTAYIDVEILLYRFRIFVKHACVFDLPVM